MKRNIFRVVRNCLGLTLDELSSKCSVSRIYLSELETGKKTHPSQKFLQAFSSACGMNLETLQFFLEQDKIADVDYSSCLLQSLENYFLNHYETINGS